jgi:hypothetical protein
VSVPRPQPVLTAAQASAAATWLTTLGVGVLAHHGLLVPDQVTGPLADLIAIGIVGVAGVASSLVAGLVARVKVTPLADPRDGDGNRLVRARPPAPSPRPTPAPRRQEPPVPVPVLEPATERIPVVDIAALRREYNLD